MTSHQSTDSSVLHAARNLLTGHVAVLPSADLGAFERFTGELIAAPKPENAVERHLAHLYASLQWRIHRAAAIEDTLLSIGAMEGASVRLRAPDANAQCAIRQATAFRAGAAVFETLARYSQNLFGQSTQVLGQLQQLQAMRAPCSGVEPRMTAAVA